MASLSMVAKYLDYSRISHREWLEGEDCSPLLCKYCWKFLSLRACKHSQLVNDDGEILMLEMYSSW